MLNAWLRQNALDRNFESEGECSSVDRVKCLRFEEFFLDYMLPNKPCIFTSTLTEKWKSRKDWVDDNGKPNLEFLEENFGSAIVPVANCEEKEYDAQRKQDMKLSEYVQYWKTLLEKDAKDLPCLYLKDWHFKRAFPKYDAYDTPEYFCHDWLNDLCRDKGDDDYQFVYMGPKNTWTPMHADVFGSYSWSANICGTKKWLLFPPWTKQHLLGGGSKLPYSVDETSHLFKYGLEVIQHSGEVIFVPSGWYHQVWNVEDCISINHNWFNGCNIQFVWRCLTDALKSVENEISDCKDGWDEWDDQCQIVLKAHHGMNYSDLLDILSYTMEKRFNACEPKDFRYYHVLFDLLRIHEVLSSMADCSKISVVTTRAKALNDRVVNFLKDQGMKL